jgi:hypothetical protein
MLYYCTAFHNTRREAMDKGAEAGDDYIPSKVGLMSVSADTAAEALSTVFRELNLWHNTEQVERSLSVGDAVAVDGVWYTCEPVGWVEMAHPPLACCA